MTRGPSSCSARSSWSSVPTSKKPLITWPPANPSSARTRSPSATRHHLRKNAVNRPRLDERDLEPEHALPRLAVDQLGAARGELRDRGSYVVDLIGDVMHARAALGEELPDRRIVAERGEELDPARTDADRRCFDPLFVDLRPVLETAPEEALVRPHRLVEVRNRDPDVVDST